MKKKTQSKQKNQNLEIAQIFVDMGKVKWILIYLYSGKLLIVTAVVAIVALLLFGFALFFKISGYKKMLVCRHK